MHRSARPERKEGVNSMQSNLMGPSRVVSHTASGPSNNERPGLNRQRSVSRFRRETERPTEEVDINSKGDPNNGAERLRYCLHPRWKSLKNRLFSCKRYLAFTIYDREQFLQKNEICRSCVQGTGIP